MALTKCNADVGVISDLGDNPNTDNNLSATQLKAKFDSAGAEIKTYLNSTLTEELDTALSSINGSSITDNTISAAKLASAAKVPGTVGIVIGTSTPTDETPIISAGQIYLKYTPAAEE